MSKELEHTRLKALMERERKCFMEEQAGRDVDPHRRVFRKCVMELPA